MRYIAALVLGYCLLTGAAGAQDARPGWLGVIGQDITKEQAAALGWDAPRGMKVARILAGGPAEKADIKKGDFLLSIDDVEIRSVLHYFRAMRSKREGTTIKVRLLREGKERVISTALAVRPASPSAHAPLPMLDTGGHMAPIVGLAFTPDGKQIVSASNDKTIRVWDVASGRTVRVIRGESALGNWGTIYAMALSPDARWLAVGGYLHDEPEIAAAVRLYDFASGKLVALLKGHHMVVFTLAFSQDGKRLVSGSADHDAIVWDVESRRSLHVLAGHTKSLRVAAFGHDNRVLTGSDDGTLRLWDDAGQLLAEMTEHKELTQSGEEPEKWSPAVRSAAFSLDGQFIASGSKDGRMALWDGRTGAFLRQLARPSGWYGYATVASLAFSPDGRWLFLASEHAYCRKYEVSTGKEFFDGKPNEDESNFIFRRDVSACTDSLTLSPDGKLLAAAQNHFLHFIDPGTDRKTRAFGSTGNATLAAGFAADGSTIAWGDTLESVPDNFSQYKLQYQLRLPANGAVLAGPENVNAAATKQSTHKTEFYLRSTTKRWPWSFKYRSAGALARYDHIIDISKDDKVEATIELNDAPAHNAGHTFSADGQTILIGVQAEIHAYDLNGKFIGAFAGHSGTVRDMASSADGRLLVSASNDQTVRLWNFKTRELIVSLFRANDGEWVMWTPQGYYTASGPGAELIGWQINRGPEHEAEYITAAQLRQHLNRPDIVARAIQLASAEDAIKEARASFSINDLFSRSVPKLQILSPAPYAAVTGGEAQMTIELTPETDPVKVISVLVNGRQIAKKMPDAGAGFPPGKMTLNVPLTSGENKIAVAASNETGESVATVTVSHRGEGALDKRGTLYILAIGVDEYKALGNVCGTDGKRPCDLRFAGRDARAFADAMVKSAGPLHERVVTRVLVNGVAPSDVPTAANVTDALALLYQAEQNDTVMLFISGHGMNEGPNYRFIPTDAAWGVGGLLRQSSVVPWYAFQEALTSANGRRILFIDTCHSGNAFNQKLLSDSYQANIVVYSSARWDQQALEDATLGGGHGLFTYALVEGLGGRASNTAGEVKNEGLRDFLRVRVNELAKQFNHEQEPQYFRARDADNYLLARVQ